MSVHKQVWLTCDEQGCTKESPPDSNATLARRWAKVRGWSCVKYGDYCDDHTFEHHRVTEAALSIPSLTLVEQEKLGWLWPVQQAIWHDLIEQEPGGWTTFSDAATVTNCVAEALAKAGYVVLDPESLR